MATRDDQLKSTLECPICLHLLDTAKLLSCSHTFCKSCLSTLYKAQPEEGKITCPLCRKTTPLTDGDISKLGTNHVVQSLIDELAGKAHFCTTCKQKTPAIRYCADCDEYMCEPCQEKHEGWERFSGHEQFSMEDVNAGRAGVKKKEKCNKHKTETEDSFCLNCKNYVCFRCRVLDHVGHDVLDAEDHERSHKERIAALLKRVETNKKRVIKHTEFVKETQEKTKIVIQGPVQRIEAACEEAISRIKENRDSLIKECKQHEDLITDKLENIVGNNNIQIACIESAGELVSNGMRGRLEGDSLVAHDTLCEELEKLLEGCKVDYYKVGNLSKCAAGLEFKTPDSASSIDLGSLDHKEGWVQSTGVELSEKNSMNAIATTPDDRMAVGSSSGGIEIFSADGQLQQTVLKDVSISDIGFLSDGGYVVFDASNNISLYTPECEKLGVKFETLSKDEGGFGGLTVCSDDQIYVSYREAKKIQIFTPAGMNMMKAVREIPCDGYKPIQIFTMKPSKMLVVKDSSTSVRVIDQSGAKKHEVMKDVDIFSFPCVCQDGSILIAWVKHEEGLVSIDQYTSELKHVQTLITDHKIENSEEREWYYLQEFLSGEIALCTPDRLYIFHKLVTPADV